MEPDFDFNEYNDMDATACANGDYNTYEENQLALDNEYPYDDCYDECEELGQSDDNWACGSLDVD